MDFSDLEKNVRERIKIGKTGEALELLNGFFKEDADSNEIALLSATYFAIVEKSKEIEQYPIKNFILSWINQVKKYARQNK